MSDNSKSSGVSTVPQIVEISKVDLILVENKIGYQTPITAITGEQ